MSDWETMESAGAVFLPAAGGRDGSTISEVGQRGSYWSETGIDDETASGLYFDSEIKMYNYRRSTGRSVRLVQDVEGSGGTSQTSSIGMQSVAGGTIASTYNVGNNENEFDYASNQTTIPDLLVSKNLVSQYEYEQLMTYYGVVKSEYSTLVPTEQGEDAKKSTPAYYVSWIDAIIYCNLRSEAENLTPVYSINDVNSITKSGSPWTQYYDVAKDENGKYYFNIVWTEGIEYYSYDTDAGVFAIDLSADGYRLPTSAEYNYFLQNTTGLITEGEYNEWCQNYTYSDSGTRVWFNGTNGTVETEVFKHCTRREEKLGFRIVRNAPAQQP